MLPGKIIQILSFNPIFFLVESFRDIIFYAEEPNAFSMGTWFIVSMVI
jgi:ABC-type polysaccharide/polyol phosphate export permease